MAWRNVAPRDLAGQVGIGQRDGSPAVFIVQGMP